MMSELLKKEKCSGSKQNKPAIVCIMGCTASGKTALAIELAQKHFFSIISVDSGMIYRGMDIGTAKPSQDELAIAPHRLIDILDPRESYSAAEFRRDSLREIACILQQGRMPLLVGGTMLYFKVLQQGISPLPSADLAIRSEIAREAERVGWKAMHERLAAIDETAAKRISPADTQRISRALEIYGISGKTLTELCAANPPSQLPYRIVNIALTPYASNMREQLEKRIRFRLQKMLQRGFVDEVAALRARGDLTPEMPSMRAVGYRQVWQYLNSAINYAEMQEQIVIATRQLAKRQMTWLRNWQNDIAWFDSEDKNLVTKIEEFLKNQNLGPS